MSVCILCGRELDQPGDPLSLDCGGDCWCCIREHEKWFKAAYVFGWEWGEKPLASLHAHPWLSALRRARIFRDAAMRVGGAAAIAGGHANQARIRAADLAWRAYHAQLRSVR